MRPINFKSGFLEPYTFKVMVQYFSHTTNRRTLLFSLAFSAKRTGQHRKFIPLHTCNLCRVMPHVRLPSHVHILFLSRP
jgi:hypothetical protein